MSTQRREDLRQCRSCTKRWEGLGQIWPIFLAWFVRAIAKVGTAPPKAAKPLCTVRVATNSLQMDYHTTQFVRFVRLAREGIRLSSRSSQSPIPSDHTNRGIPATLRLSLLHIPAPSGFAHLSPALP
jgi:hypothetical protein